MKFKLGFNFCADFLCHDYESANRVSDESFTIDFVRWSDPAIPPISDTKEAEIDFNIKATVIVVIILALLIMCFGFKLREEWKP